MQRMPRCMSSIWYMAVSGAALLAAFPAEQHSSAEPGDHHAPPLRLPSWDPQAGVSVQSLLLS